MKYQTWNCGSTAPGDSLLDTVLRARGLDTAEQRDAFLHPENKSFHSPLLLKGMTQAVARIELAIANEEPIAVYGDYDVDGITATALLTLYFRNRGVTVTPYIPDRIEEGYGLNSDAIASLAAQGIRLIITVDCGITAVEEVALARSLGVEVVITDHHSCKDTLPAAAAVVNPQQPDCAYPNCALAGVAVAWKLAIALAADKGPEVEQQFLPLAAIGTVADAMPLTGENRVIVARGLPTVGTQGFPGLHMLLQEVGGCAKPVTTITVGYHLAPRINAAGRMGQVGVSLELLLTEDAARAEVLSKELCVLNSRRQAVEQEIYEHCVTQAESFGPNERTALVLAHADWHQGVVGIVASRLAEKYAAPVFIISLSEDGRGKGSCRTYGGFNLFSALGQCADLLESFGGHEFAAGFTIREENLPLFRQRVNEIAKTRSGGEAMCAALEVDAVLPDFRLLTLEQVQALEVLEPCGTGNPKAVFLVQGTELSDVRDVGGGRHLRIRAQKLRKNMDGIFFSATSSQHCAAPGRNMDIAFTPSLNHFNGNVSVQMQVSDLRPSLTRAQQERHLLDRFLAGEILTSSERESLLPERCEFAAVWRYVSAKGRVDESERDFVRNVAKTHHINESVAHILLALTVLQEHQLVEASLDRGRVLATALDAGQKVDLESSALIQRLKTEPTAV